jgi:hypothetical protein
MISPELFGSGVSIMGLRHKTITEATWGLYLLKADVKAK